MYYCNLQRSVYKGIYFVRMRRNLLIHILCLAYPIFYTKKKKMKYYKRTSTVVKYCFVMQIFK